MTPAFRNILAAAISQAALLCAPQVSAAGVQLSDPNCDRFELSGPETAPNQILSCIVSNVPGCTISGATATAQIGTPLLLTASCSGSPTNWEWTGGSCAGKDAKVCSASEAAGTSTYTVKAKNGIGWGVASPAANVTWSAAAPLPPTGCTLAANPNQLSAAGLVALTATCSSSGPTPTSYDWTGPGVTSTTTSNVQSLSVTPPANFTVTARNQGVAGNVASTSVNLPVVTGTPIDCGPAFSATKVIDAKWVPGNEFRYWTNKSGYYVNNAALGFYANEALVVRFTAPAADGSLQIKMYATNTAPYGLASQRTVTVSEKACDFAVPKSSVALWANDTSQSAVFDLRTDGVTEFGTLSLVPGQQYFLNVSNFVKGVNKCDAGRCDVFFSFYDPN
jgi:hypothetical protein